MIHQYFRPNWAIDNSCEQYIQWWIKGGGAGVSVTRGPSLKGALYKAVILVLRIYYIILFLSTEAITMIMIVSLSLI